MTRQKSIIKSICLILALIFSIAVGSTFCACQVNDDSPEQENTLIGIWEINSFEILMAYDNIEVYETINELKNNKHFRITADDMLYVEDINGDSWPPYSLTISAYEENDYYYYIKADRPPEYPRLSFIWRKDVGELRCLYNVDSSYEERIVADIYLYKSTEQK